MYVLTVALSKYTFISRENVDSKHAKDDHFFTWHVN